MPEVMYLLFPMAYLLLILFGFVCSLAVYDYEVDRVMIFDILVALAGLAGGIGSWILGGAPTADHTMWLTSLEFIVFPVIFILVVAIVYYEKRARKRLEKLEVGDELLSQP
jgi:membrane protein DedA with SNARE-associated domain